MKPAFIVPLLCYAVGPYATTKSAASSLIGNWRLIAQRVMVVTRKLPNETLAFDSNGQFRHFRKKRLAAQGIYRVSHGPSCGQQADHDQLMLEATGTEGYMLGGGAYTLRGDTLVIDETDFCIPEGSGYTYKRTP